MVGVIPNPDMKHVGVLSPTLATSVTKLNEGQVSKNMVNKIQFMTRGLYQRQL